MKIKNMRIKNIAMDDSLRDRLTANKALLPLITLGAFALLAGILWLTAPTPKKNKPQSIAPLVEVQPLNATRQQVEIPALGTVIPAQEITVKAQVAGEVQAIEPGFVPGGFFDKDEEMLRIDPQDYTLALRQVQAEVATARYNLKLEQGYQKVAAKEWELLKDSARGTEAEAELALRKPQLIKAQAELGAALAKLRQAKLNLERTHIRAPFSAMVESKHTDVGASVSTQDTLAHLVGTDEFWIEVSLSVDTLHWIRFAEKEEEGTSTARVLLDATSIREGQVLRLLPSLEEQGRMARTLIKVTDPLNLNNEQELKPLLLGSYVSVLIDGPVLEDVYAVPRTLLRDNKELWLINDEDRLEILLVTPLWSTVDTIFFRPDREHFVQGKALVVSDLSAPVPGMRLRRLETFQGI